MKTMLLALSFLLFTSTMILFSELVQASGNVLRDLKGDELRPGVPYYIVSTLFPLGGGVSLDKVTNNTCPLDVTLLRFPLDNGIPVILSTSDEEESVITDSTSVSISFDTTSSCAESTVWRVREDQLSSTMFLTIGGFEGNSSTVFRLINEGPIFSYKLLAIYAIHGLPAISDVGVVNSLFGARRLALTEPPLLVSFREARDDINGLKDE